MQEVAGILEKNTEAELVAEQGSCDPLIRGYNSSLDYRVITRYNVI